MVFWRGIFGVMMPYGFYKDWMGPTHHSRVKIFDFRETPRGAQGRNEQTCTDRRRQKKMSRAARASQLQPICLMVLNIRN
jgi:hypothetical protein